MVEAEVECGVYRKSAAEADAAIHAEFGAALQQQADDLKEVLVPADGDAVLGDAAEACHDTLIQTFVDFGDVVNRAKFDALAVGIDA